VRQATHNLVYTCPDDIYVVFDSLNEARSFKIDYRIIAANLPKPVEGALHVIVRREDNEEGDGSAASPKRRGGADDGVSLGWRVIPYP
jgi:hypothetical protein